METYRMYRKKQSFLHRNFSFSGYISAGDFWSEMGIRVIGFLCALIFLCILIAVVVPGSVEEVIAITNVVTTILAVIWVIPMIVLTRRRLRDAGFTAKSYLCLLLPGIGLIVFVVRLCSQSVGRETDNQSFNF